MWDFDISVSVTSFLPRELIRLGVTVVMSSSSIEGKYQKILAGAFIGKLGRVPDFGQYPTSLISPWSRRTAKRDVGKHFGGQSEAK